MAARTPKLCNYCETTLSKDEIGINKKILDSKNMFLCLNCLSEYLECSVEELQDKIEEFKHEGCKLFS